MDTTAQEIWERIQKSDSIILFGHKDPDGDCVGSTRGFGHLLKRLFPKKEVHVRSSLPKSLPSGILEQDDIPEEVFQKSLGLLLDLSEIGRAEDRRVSLCPELIIIDHHVPSQKALPIPAYRLIDAPSCTYVLSKFLEEIGIDMVEEEASYFLMGLLTDTDRFLLDCRKEAFQGAMALASRMKDPGKVARELYRPRKELLSFRAFAYTHYRIRKDICYLVLKKEDYLALGLGQNEVANEVSAFLGLENTAFAVFFVEREDGKVRVEFRCNLGDKDVEGIARKFGGGGHHNASGCLISSLDEVESVLEALEKE